MELTHCELFLLHAGDPCEGLQAIQLAEKQLEIGSQVDGPGRLLIPGIAPRHAKIWRDKSGCWLKALLGQDILLNSVPVSAKARTKLVQGDLVTFQVLRSSSEFWVLCRRAAEAEAADAKVSNASSTDGQATGSAVESEGGKGFTSLSRAEYDVLAWMARGVVEVDEISSRLFRSVNTIRTQLSKIYEKMGVHSRADLLGLLIRNGNSAERHRRGANRFLGQCHCAGGNQPGCSKDMALSRSRERG